MSLPDPSSYGPASSTIRLRCSAADVSQALGRLADMGLNAQEFEHGARSATPCIWIDPPHPSHPIREYGELVSDAHIGGGRQSIYRVDVQKVVVKWIEGGSLARAGRQYPVPTAGKGDGQ